MSEEQTSPHLDGIPLVQQIAQSLFDKKGLNLVALDLRGVSSIADFCIIADGYVQRHMQALCNQAKQVLHTNGISRCYVDGFQSEEWIALDGGSILVHLFSSEARQRYQLEKIWPDAAKIELELTRNSLYDENLYDIPSEHDDEISAFDGWDFSVEQEESTQPKRKLRFIDQE
jgi:ribosome-associated protein